MSEISVSAVKQIIKSAVLSLIFLFFGVTALTLTVNASGLSLKVLHPALQVIKPLSVFLGVMFGVRGSKGAIKGLLAGGIAFLVALLILWLAAKTTYAFPTLIVEALAFLAFGGISGMIAATVKNS